MPNHTRPKYTFTKDAPEILLALQQQKWIGRGALETPVGCDSAQLQS